ncbi:MAG: hypothetical protein RSE12_11155 [Fuscovulum sp.]|jgi:hypothetical protein|nr:MAG: hypothetical protein RSE12_11155 [Fuscovulum sp.]
MIRRFWRKSPALTLAFGLALAATLFFGGRAVLFAVTLNYRSEKPIAGWMTPRYIARTYGLDREDLAVLLSTVDKDDLRQPLYTIAREQGVPVTDLIAPVQEAIDALDAAE